MSSVRPMVPASMAVATLLSVTAAVTVGATEQDGPPTQLDGMCVVYGADDAPLPCDYATPQAAMRGDVRCPVDWAPSPGSAGEPAVSRAGPHGRPFLTVLSAIPLVTYAGTTRARGAEVLTLADRFAMSQLIGAGYVVNPRFRFGVMGIFNEVLTGLAPAAAAWQFGGIAPIAIGTFDHLIIGGGPMIGYRSGGKNQSDVGAVVLTGASIPLRKGLALNIAAPTTALFVRRVTVSVGVAVGVAKVF